MFKNYTIKKVWKRSENEWFVLVLCAWLSLLIFSLSIESVYYLSLLDYIWLVRQLFLSLALHNMPKSHSWHLFTLDNSGFYSYSDLGFTAFVRLMLYRSGCWDRFLQLDLVLRALLFLWTCVPHSSIAILYDKNHYQRVNVIIPLRWKILPWLLLFF